MDFAAARQGDERVILELVAINIRHSDRKALIPFSELRQRGHALPIEVEGSDIDAVFSPGMGGGCIKVLDNIHAVAGRENEHIAKTVSRAKVNTRRAIAIHNVIAFAAGDGVAPPIARKDVIVVRTDEVFNCALNLIACGMPPTCWLRSSRYYLVVAPCYSHTCKGHIDASV